jgi:AcrR family transcriptional regulator
MACARLTRSERQTQTREQLVQAATEVFARRGYHAAKVEEIAERAGFSHGAVYSNFSGKEELFLAVFERYMTERIEEVSRATAHAPEGSFSEQARAGADQWMQRFNNDRATFLLHLEFMVHAARDPQLGALLRERMAALRIEIERRLVARGEQTDTRLPLPASDLALIVRALGIGLAVEALHQPEQEVDTQLYGNFVALLVRLLEA